LALVPVLGVTGGEIDLIQYPAAPELWTYFFDGFVSAVVSFTACPCSLTAPTAPPVPPPVSSPISLPPSPSVGSPTGETTSCFSGSSSVQVLDKGATRMDALKIGDKVLSSFGAYYEVFSFSHYDAEIPTEYIQIQTTASNNDAPLEISPEHMLYVCQHGPNSEKATLLPAGLVQVGEFLVLGKEDHLSCIEVKSLSKVTRRGAYAPLTTNGNLVVNGVLASSYIAQPAFAKSQISYDQQHWVQHVALAPYRFYCGLVVNGCGEEVYNEASGLSYAAAMWVPVLHWLECHTNVLLTFVHLLILPIHWMVFNIQYILVALLGFYIIIVQQKKGQAQNDLVCSKKSLT